MTVFQSRLGEDDVWHVGSSLMKNYYVVYDMTPFDELGEDYIMIGIGLQNQQAEVLERHYNYTSPAYHPERRSRDSSRAKPGVIDSYTMRAPTRAPQPAPEPPRPRDALLSAPSKQDSTPNTTNNATSAHQAPLPAPNNTNDSQDVETSAVHDPAAFMSGEKIVPASSLSPAEAPSPAATPHSFFDEHFSRIIVAASLLGSCFLLLLLCCCRHRKRRDSSRPISSSNSHKNSYIYQHFGPSG